MTKPDHIDLRFGLFVLVPLALAVAWMAITPRWWRTLAGPGGISVHRVVRSRGWAWHDVYDLRVEPHPAQRSADAQSLTYLYDTDGRRFLLPHVDDWQLPDLRAEIDELRAVAAVHRGMAWEPRPGVEARIRRRAGHRKAHERAFIGVVLAFFAGLTYLLWEVAVGDGPHPFLLLLCAPLAAYALLLPCFRLLASRAPAHT
ncbi:hypothetical protein [Streptomyces sp. MBT53]|uniref:hypothetical protein n=1 Tax=Streptomyces sp. MBT53 TaxID=1488384 RepID=UPI0019146009|nr:hypothetical protein [Streptomyces sp. MBT53]MBK6015315.1 hypothetical protein [Streptomyces sp. MBT53]